MPRRTRKNYHDGDLPMHAATFHGVHGWSKAMFEKLGWMVLAKAKGYGYKIPVYKKSIEHLIETIEHIMTEYHDADKLHDLNVILMNARCLNAFVKKAL